MRASETLNFFRRGIGLTSNVKTLLGYKQYLGKLQALALEAEVFSERQQESVATRMLADKQLKLPGFTEPNFASHRLTRATALKAVAGNNLGAGL